MNDQNQFAAESGDIGEPAFPINRPNPIAPEKSRQTIRALSETSAVRTR
ncbi:hypothetical protein FHR23_001423 [Stakelama sediminis]|uniref:Uncharacterized protein n=1 Tax=Stakelama sediminis TaxID=463200 RepID=A0A840YY93_9SPHN|nr:hypothetical protein [Stakelama sediminis]MBB5718500.1 hypothetical protein [Stakelama sediminis]